MKGGSTFFRHDVDVCYDGGATWQVSLKTGDGDVMCGGMSSTAVWLSLCSGNDVCVESVRIMAGVGVHMSEHAVDVR